MGSGVVDVGQGAALAQPATDDASAAPAEKQRELIAERDRLLQEATTHFSAGRLDESIAASERMLALTRQIVGRDGLEVAVALDWLSRRYVDRSDFDAARTARREQVQILVKHHGDGDWRVADARWLLAHIDIVAALSASQREGLDVAAQAHQAASAARGRGEMAVALELAQGALKLREGLLPLPHPDVANSLNLVGLLFEETGDAERALELQVRALTMMRRLFPSGKYPDGHPSLAAALYNLAHLHASQLRFRAARKFGEQAVETFVAVYPAREYPGGHASIVLALNNLASVCESDGDLPKARDYYGQVVAMCETLYTLEAYPRGHETHATAETNLGNVLSYLGDYAGARRHHQRALAIRERLYPHDEFPQGHPEVGRCYNGLAYVCSKEGDLVGARRFFEQELQIYEQVYAGADHALVADAHDNLGVLLTDLGDYEAAQTHLEQALAMLERLYPQERFPDGHPSLATALNNLGSLFEEQIQYATSRTYYEQALAVFERLHARESETAGHEKLAVAISNLGTIAAKQQDYPAAAAYLERAVEMCERLYPQIEFPHGHPSLASALHKLGYLHHAQGELDAAERFYAQALDMRTALYPPDAFPHGHPSLATNLANLAVVRMGQGNQAGALELLAECDRMDRAGLRAIVDVSTDATMRDYLAANEARTNTHLMAARFAPENPAAQRLAYAAVERRKTAVFDAILKRRQIERRAAEDSAVRDAAFELRRLRQRWAEVKLLPPGPPQIDEERSLSEDVRRREAELNDLLADAVRNAGEADASVDSLIAKLNRESALVEFVRYASFDPRDAIHDYRRQTIRYAAFVVRSDDAKSPLVLVDLGEAAVIDRQVSALRQSIMGVSRQLQVADEAELEEEYLDAAKPLSDAIFAPLDERLDGAKTVYLAPDGQLTRVGFEALVDRAGNYLAERFAFAYLTGGGDLLRARTAAADRTVVFAAPDYDLDRQAAAPSADLLARLVQREGDSTPIGLPAETRGLSWTALPATQLEAREIAKVLATNEAYSPVDSFVGPEALEGVLKRIRPPRLLHLATHGFYLPDARRAARSGAADGPDDGSRGAATTRLARLRTDENPLLRSGIVLAGANRSHDETIATTPASDAATSELLEDGWVTAEEIGLMDFAGTELVVLSACETGLGDLRTGEGVAGLRRAFLYAGAETVITSLYKVPDADTQKLMHHFYTRLADGETRLAALHGAQQAIIRERRAQHGAAHPFFWASFILVGETE